VQYSTVLFSWVQYQVGWLVEHEQARASSRHNLQRALHFLGEGLHGLPGRDAHSLCPAPAPHMRPAPRQRGVRGHRFHVLQVLYALYVLYTIYCMYHMYCTVSAVACLKHLSELGEGAGVQCNVPSSGTRLDFAALYCTALYCTVLCCTVPSSVRVR